VELPNPIPNNSFIFPKKRLIKMAISSKMLSMANAKIPEKFTNINLIIAKIGAENLVNSKTGAGKKIAKIPAYPKLNTTTENNYYIINL
jgi:hypothetical protein